MKIGIVGCGLIGNRRGRVAQVAGDEVVLVADPNPERARSTGDELNSGWTADWQTLISHPEIEAIVISTVNKSLMPITLAALAQGKHVLGEKPMGRNRHEAKEMYAAAQAAGRVLKVGFNHRHHPALWQAHQFTQADQIGPVLSIRAAYGHGGRPGYKQDWPDQAELVKEGELLDQGVDVVDLCRWFLGDFSQVSGMLSSWFWKAAPLEDNGFAMLRTDSGQIASIHTSWTQWKDLFRFEIFGRDGYVLVNGLGSSYGPETLTLGLRRAESGPPEEHIWEFPGPDLSWQVEWQEFTWAIRDGHQPTGNSYDGLQAARLIDAIYTSAQENRVIEMKDFA